MAYAPLDYAPRENAFTKNTSSLNTTSLKRSPAPGLATLSKHATPAQQDIFRRFLAAMMAARQRQADAEIVSFLNLRGGRLTDEAEREIERRFLHGLRKGF
jgi:hypothetical protein